MLSKITFNAAARQVIAVAALASLAETAVLAGLIAGYLPHVLAAFAHVGFSTAVVIWALHSRLLVRDRLWALLLAATLPLLGPLGSAGTLATMILAKFYRLSAKSVEDWHASLFSPLEDDGVRAAPKVPTASQPEAGVSPFADILAFGTIEQKQKVMALITKEFRTEFAPAVRLALGDSNPAIRVQAASAVTKIENDFTATTLKLTKGAEQQNDAQHLLSLGDHYAAYAATGFLDQEREQSCRENALGAYQQYLEIHPEGDLRVATACAKLLLELDRLDEARLWFALRAERVLPAPLSLLYMAVLFRLRRFEELRVVAANHVGANGAGDEFLDEAAGAVKLWAGAA